MNLFSISQLQQYSGIKAHTIRIWEQRYDALKPIRSEGNTRYYDGTQLRRLLNIVSLMDFNFKVSELCLMSDEKMFQILDQQIKDTVSDNESCEYFIAQLISAAMTFDEPFFEKIFSACLLRYGIKDAFVKVVYPMLIRIGLMWANDSIPSSQEHFISNLLRQKLFSAIDALPPAKNAKDSWLLFLPENEFHEMGLLLSNYLIRQSGNKAVYLGANVPFETLTTAVKQVGPSHLLFFFIHYDLPENAQAYLNAISKKFSKQKIYFAGNDKLIDQLSIKKDLSLLKSVQDLVATLAN